MDKYIPVISNGLAEDYAHWQMDMIRMRKSTTSERSLDKIRARILGVSYLEYAMEEFSNAKDVADPQWHSQ